MNVAMNIALLGYGKMGKHIEKWAERRGHTIVFRSFRDWTRVASARDQAAIADVYIDFSAPEALLPHLDWAIAQKKPIVIGTTGWQAERGAVQQKVKASGIGCIASPNFSLSVLLFRQLAQQAAALLTSLLHYDVAGIELHHQHKKDAPSGTAKALQEALLPLFPHKQEIPFASVRCGEIPGTHTLMFDSIGDTITLTHEAKSRDGFAEGAVIAAEWLLGKTGFFTLDDLIQTRRSP